VVTASVDGSPAAIEPSTFGGDGSDAGWEFPLDPAARWALLPGPLTMPAPAPLP
jgi:hypothetical protein